MTEKIHDYTSEQLLSMSRELREISNGDEGLDENERYTEKGEAARGLAVTLKKLAKDLAMFEGGFKSSFLKGFLRDVDSAIVRYNEFKAKY